MNVLIITYYWPPSGGPGVQRWLKFVKYLPSFDIQPIALTVDPAHAEYPVIDLSLEVDVAPDLKVYRTKCKGVYDWYKKFTGTKTAPYSGFANEGKPGLLQKVARFVRGNFFLPDARRGWNKYAFAEACQIIEKNAINAIITTGPPHSTHLIGLRLKKKYNLKWIVDYRDPWTSVFYNESLYQTRWAKKINRSYEQAVLDACDHLTLVADDRESLNIAPSKVVFIPNGYDTADFCNRQTVCSEIFTICYTGTVAGNYPIGQLPDALNALRQEKITFKLRFVGKVTDPVREKLVAQLDDSVEFVDFVPHNEAIHMMMSSDVLLLLIPNADNNKFILTGKVFEYLATGKPVLVVGPPESKAAQIVQQANAGAAFEDDDVEGMKNFLSQQYQNQIKGIHPVPDWEIIRQFSRERLTQRLAEIIA